MRLIRRQYLGLVPFATLCFIFGTIYSTHSWTSTQQLNKDRWSQRPGDQETQQYHNGQNYDDPNCADFPRDRLRDIQIVLRIGSTQPFDQISSHINNITNCISNLIVISDRVEEIGNGFWSHDIIADLPKVYWEGIDKDDDETDQTAGLKAYANINKGDSSWKQGKHANDRLTHRQGWLLDRFKFLPMVEYAYNVNPSAKWFYFIEADTYVVWDTLFRLLDRYDPQQQWYFGSPSPGRELNGEKTWFAYGGNGFILSRTAIQRLVSKDPVKSTDESGNANRTELSLTERWAGLVKSDCCGDSVLGFALANKGVFLSGLYPIFNPHPLHGIPFGPSGKPYWCQPVLSLHKTWPGDVPGLTQFVKDHTSKQPLVYTDLFKYLNLDQVAQRDDWQNSEWNGFEEAPEAPVHETIEACAAGCHAHGECFQWTYWTETSWKYKSIPKKKCTFVRSIRLGTHKDREESWTTTAVWTSGWDIEKISKWAKDNACGEPEWVEPSLQRIY
ncbi:hypothetical protein ZTR_00053 [Talaromyces verruculosus]|nr:hypothetical protein ZTR_00053 [Talaromyces verruculosus]